MKKVAIALLIVAALAVAGAATLWQLFSKGVGGFDDWVVREVVDVAEIYLVPDIRFESFDYNERTVTLRDVRIIAPDGTDVVTAATLNVTLESIPVMGEGLVISRVEIDGADLRLIREDSTSQTVSFRGLVPFLETDNIQQQEQVEENKRLDRAFAIKHIALSNCSISYEPGDDQPTMSLTGISADMDVKPHDDDANSPGGLGTYDVQLAIDRSPILSIDLDGAINLDTLALDLTTLALAADLENEQATGALPGELQRLIEQHDIRGSVRLEATGTVLASAPMDSTLDGTLTLDTVNVAAGDYRFPVESAIVNISVANRLARFPKLTIQSCGGTISANDARIDLSEARNAELQWTIEGFELRELLRTHTGGEDAAPKIAGVLTSSGNATASLTNLPDSVSGAGELSVRDGRLVNMPLQKALAAALGVLDLITMKQAKLKDRGDVTFDLTGQGVDIEKATVQTSVLAARGNGTIYYDQRLDLRVNAGPLEKIQEKTGPIGDIFGLITDQLVKYDIEGKLTDPKVKVRPLGLGG